MDDYMRIKCVARFLEEYLIVTKDVKRHDLLENGNNIYYELQACRDLKFVRQVLNYIPDHILEKYKNLFPCNSVVLDCSTELSFLEIMNIFKNSPDCPMKDKNETADEIFIERNIPVSKPETYCTVLKHNNSWISGHTCILSIELYVFIARICWMELAIQLRHILHPKISVPESLISLIYPPVLTVYDA